MNPAPFSLAKITMPRLQKVLHRQRLFRLLDKSRSYPGIWVSGPGGSGKTTLIASYIEQHHLPCLWYQIDERDADIATFFYYLGVAGKKLAPEKKDLPHLNPEYAPGIAAFTRRFFEDLFDRMEKPGVFVLDNYQDALPDCLLHEVLSSALKVVPEDLNIIVSSRSEPPPVLARARAGGLLHEIGWPELRLHPHETNELVRFLARTPPSEAFMDFLHKKIDGWTAGVLLLIKQAETGAVDLQSFSQSTVQEVFDYFSSELFDKADSNTRAFLLSTAVLPNMSAGMAGKLTGAENAEQVLFRLWQNHWFTERYPGGRDIRYQYHPMFREFLLSRMVQTYPDERMKALKKTAARLLEADGQIEPAVELLFESGKQRAVLGLILRQAQEMVIQGRKQTLAQWLRRLPAKYRRKHPLVLYWLGMCRHRMDPEEGRGYFEQAFTILEAQKDTAGVCASLCGLLDSITYGFNTFKPLDPWIAKLTPLSGEYEHLPTQEIKGLLTASAIFAMTFRQPDHPEFPVWKSRGLDMMHGGSPEYVRLRVIMALCSHRIFSGDLAGAGSLLELYRELVQSPNVPPYARITLKHLETFYYFLTGSFDACRQTAAEALDLAAATGVHILSPLILGHAAASALSSGNLAGARKRLLPMTRYTNSADWILMYFYILRIWEALLEGDKTKALANEELAAPYIARTGMMATAAIGHLGMALARHAAGKTAEAANLLDQALTLCHRMGTWQVAFACYLAQAELSLDAGDDDAVLQALHKAMAIGKARGYVNTWFWRPDTITRLCCKALEADIAVAYVQDLIRRRNLAPETPPLEIPNWPWPVKIYTLGRFALVRDGRG
ncbi:MAG TPA: hypothetical protein VKO20_02085, partial [Desulfosalsimonadaceae bacterium]|nr:hypothetical protein [Desulfosalsimonadaceae bacterium]